MQLKVQLTDDVTTSGLKLRAEAAYTRGVRTADADIRGPGSADFLADADGPRISQTNTFADADYPWI